MLFLRTKLEFKRIYGEYTNALFIVGCISHAAECGMKMLETFCTVDQIAFH